MHDFSLFSRYKKILTIKQRPACRSPRFQGSVPYRRRQHPEHRSCPQLGQVQRAPTFLGGWEPPPHGRLLATDHAAGKRAAQAGRLKFSRGPPRRPGAPPLGKEFRQLQTETQTSSLICYHRYESYTWIVKERESQPLPL